MSPGVGLDASCPCRDSKPDLPAFSLVTILIAMSRFPLQVYVMSIRTANTRIRNTVTHICVKVSGCSNTLKTTPILYLFK